MRVVGAFAAGLVVGAIGWPVGVWGWLVANFALGRLWF